MKKTILKFKNNIIKNKNFLFVIMFTFMWFFFSLSIAIPWINEIALIYNPFLSWLIVSGIALIPGLAMAFLYSTMILKKNKKPEKNYNVPISILIAAYNEENYIIDTIKSIVEQKYNSEIEILICNDGSKDNTGKLVDDYIKNFKNDNIKINHIKLEKNSGKSNALNSGLKLVTNNITITIDADTILHDNALQSIVNKLYDGNTHAVAGVVLTKNTFTNFITRIQQWDYMLGMTLVKRAQSAYGATLVAQGAFSAFKTEILKIIGGWDDTVGEDIVLSWKIIEKGFTIDYEPNSIVFTNVPNSYKKFFNQRKRWSRGLIEAFKNSPKLLLKNNKFVPFIYYNALFPFLDACFAFLFIPSVIAAIFFQYYLLVGLLTLLLLPLTIFVTFLIFFKQKDTLNKNGLSINENFIGFIFFIFIYQILQVPATLSGYFSEIFKLKKTW